MCAQEKLRSAWASAQFDQSLPCPPQGKLKSLAAHKAHIEDLDQTARMRRLIYLGRVVRQLSKMTDLLVTATVSEPCVVFSSHF